MIHLDFETISVPNLGDVGSFAYSSHAEADIVSCAWARKENRPSLWSPFGNTTGDDLHDLFERVKDGETIAAWNATFEFDFWNRVMVPKYSWPVLPKRQLFDVQALALSLAMPADLDTCAKLLNMEELKDKRGKDLMRKLSFYHKPTKLNPSGRWSYEAAAQDYEDYFDYNRQDVVVEREIYNRLKRYMYPRFEHRMWLATLHINEHGIPVDESTTDAVLEVLKKYEESLTEELVRITDGEIRTANQVLVIRQFLRDRGLDIPDMGAATVKAHLEDRTVDDPLVYRVLELRQLLARSSVAKFEKLKEMIDGDGRIHNVMRYHNSTTGRWGASSFQIHNMPRGDVADIDDAVATIRTRDIATILKKYPEIKKTCSSLVRPIIKAEPAYRLLIADYEAIEAITISWLVDHRESLAVVRSGRDIYKWFATRINPGTRYGDVTKSQRKRAKVCLLGLGYQMGAPTFKNSSAGYGIDVSDSDAERYVQLYRRVFKSVKAMWYGLEDAALNTVTTGVARSYGRLRFSLEGDFLRMRLPSSRKISYPYPTVEMVTTPWGQKKKGLVCWRRHSKTKKWIRDTVTPGTLTENAVQATARDIMAEAKLRLFKNGYNVLFSVHDEIICHNRMDFGDLEEMIGIMCDTDAEVYPGLPIRASGFVTKRYRKE